MKQTKKSGFYALSALFISSLFFIASCGSQSGTNLNDTQQKTASAKAVVVNAAATNDTLDQSQTLETSISEVGSGGGLGQIFTAGYYGTLDRVSLFLDNYSDTPPAGAVLNISIQTVIGGLPSGIQLGSSSISLSAIPPHGSPGWIDANIYGHACIAPGTQYALVLKTNYGIVDWYTNALNTSYTGGEEVINLGDGWTAANPPQPDAYVGTFKTYFIPDVLDLSRTQEGTGFVSARSWSQNFTADMNGCLDRAYVYAYSEQPIGVIIQNASGLVIGQGTIPNASVPGWVGTGINGVALLTAGSQYALVLQGDFVWDFATEGMRLQTYVAKSIESSQGPTPAGITPCSGGVCPEASGNVTPPESTAGVTSNVQFKERRDGTVHGVLNFNDSKTGNFVLQGCTTESADCRLTVTTFSCSDQHSITIAGSYTPKGGTSSDYRLTLSGTKDGIGTFTLNSGSYTYTVTHNGIVDVTCP